MNLLENIALWNDVGTSESPPITWNAVTKRFEVLLSDPGAGNARFNIGMVSPVENADDTISFDYAFGNLTPNGTPNMFLCIVKNGSTVESTTTLEDGLEGRIEWEPLEVGAYYSIVLTTEEGSYASGGFYDIEATITPLSAVVPVDRVLPWWYCLPKVAPAPCPIRPTTFVPFKDYDPDFKYPLASSRVPRKNPLAPVGEECATCSPELVAYTPPVDS